MARTILALGLLVLLIAFIRGAEDDERIRLVYNLHLFSSILKTTVCLLLTLFLFTFFVVQDLDPGYASVLMIELRIYETKDN